MDKQDTVILLIEDDPSITRLIEKLLASNPTGDFTILSSVRLSEGMEILSSREVDLVILDLGLPDSSGIDTLTTVRSYKPEIPTLILTGNEDERTAVEAIKEGAQDYIEKTRFDAHTLTRSIRYAIERNLLELELKKHEEILKKKVEERTRHLVKVNEELEVEIEERIRIQNTLIKNEKSYRTLAENLPGAVYRLFIKPERKMHVFNNMIESITGYKISELTRGEHCELESIILIEDLPHIKATLISAINSSVPFELEYRIKHKDGEVRSLYERGKPIREHGGETIYIDGVILDQTDRKKAENALIESERRLQLALEASNQGLWDYNKATGELYLSPTYYSMLGYNKDEYPGDESVDFVKCFPSVFKDLSDLVKKKIGPESMEFSNEHILTDSNNMERWILCQGMVIERDHSGLPLRLLGTHIDITEQKLYEKALRESEKKYRLLVESTRTGFAITDIDGVILDANQEYARLSGHENLSRIQGRNILEWTAEYDVERYKKQLKECLKGLVLGDLEIDYIWRDGKTIPIELSASILETGAGRNIMILCRDISERREIQEKEKLHRQQLLQADKMISLGILVSGVAHEINNPNHFIMSNIQILKESWNSIVPILEKYHEENGDFLISGISYSEFRVKLPKILQRVVNGSRRIKSIVSELRQYASHKPGEAMEKLNVSDVVNSAITLMSNMIRKSTNNFILDIDESLPAVTGNFQRLEQVVINLLQNACQSLSDKDAGVKISTGYNKASNTVNILVVDDGTGIPQESIDHISDPFFTTKRDSGGTGLGLSITATIIREHGGSLKFESEQNKGTRVTVSIPIEGNAGII